MADIFKEIKKQAKQAGIKPTGKGAEKWFKSKIRELKKEISASKVIRSEGTFAVRPGLGHMYFYFYDPKFKKTLPFYDRFPLAIIIERYKDSVLTINLHYLHPATRVKLLNKLLEFATNDKFDKNTKLKLSYNLVKNVSKLREARPALKRHLFSHMKSRALKIQSDQWLLAALLPVQQFEKTSATKVWSNSRKLLK